MIAFSVILCTFNRAHCLPRALDGLRAARDWSDGAGEVIVVDNNSTDGSATIVAERMTAWPALRAVQETRQGLSYARNRGAVEARGRHLLFLDDDARVGDGYMQCLADVLTAHDPDFFGGPVLPEFERPPPAWFDPAVETRRYAEEAGFSRTVGISGANYGVRRAVWESLGGFSVDLGMVGGAMAFGEDRDLLERYRARTPLEAQRVYYAPDLAVRHAVEPYKIALRYQLRRQYRMAESRERIFRAAGTRPVWRSRAAAAAHVLLLPLTAAWIVIRRGFGPRAWFMAAAHAWATGGRVAGVFAPMREKEAL